MSSMKDAARVCCDSRRLCSRSDSPPCKDCRCGVHVFILGPNETHLWCLSERHVPCCIKRFRTDSAESLYSLGEDKSTVVSLPSCSVRFLLVVCYSYEVLR